MAEEKQPWEDESLKGEYYKEKARMKKPPPVKKAAPAGAVDAWGKAEQFSRRNRKIAKLTEPLRKSAPGQD